MKSLLLVNGKETAINQPEETVGLEELDNQQVSFLNTMANGVSPEGKNY